MRKIHTKEDMMAFHDEDHIEHNYPCYPPCWNMAMAVAEAIDVFVRIENGEEPPLEEVRGALEAIVVILAPGPAEHYRSRVESPSN